MPSPIPRLGLRTNSAIAAIAVTLTVASVTAAPTIKRVSPVGLNPGQTTRVTLSGGGLTEIQQLRLTNGLSFPLAEGVENNGNLNDRALFDCTLPSDTPLGLQALRVVGADGASGLRLFLIDDLPTVEQGGDNRAIEIPQAVPYPVAVDGVLGNLERRFFRFEAATGARVAIEVFARRLGSALDPLIVLYEENGHEVAAADDVFGLGGDCQLVYQCEQGGGYIVELRDIRYRGGDDFPFRLRIGDFPCVQTAYPLAVQRSVATQVEFAGVDSGDVANPTVTVPADWPHNWYPVSARRSGGAASGFATVQVSEHPEFLEQEPNDAVDNANVVTMDMQLNGRMQSPGDVDRFQLTVEKGARFLFSGVTRQEGAPTDLVLRVLDREGKQLVTADDEGVNEGRLNHTFAEAGEYVFEVSDLLNRGGPEYAYRVEVEAYQPGYRLEVQGDAVNVPAGGTAILGVQATRSGYNDNIDLTVEGLPEGVIASPATIGPGQTQGFVSLSLPAEGVALDLSAAEVVGAATISGKPVRVKAEATGWLRGQWNNLAVVPAPARSAVVAAAAKPTKLNLELEPGEVVFGRDLKASITVKVKRGEGLDAEVQLATNPEKDAIPKEIALALKPIPKGADSIALEFSATGKAPLGAFSLVLTGTLKQDKTTVTATTPVVNYRLSAPITLTAEPAAGALKIGGSLTVKVRAVRNPAFSGAIKLTAEGLPAGVTLADAVIPAEASEIEVTLNAAGDAAAGKISGAKLKAAAADNAALTAEIGLPEIVIE